MQLWPAGQGNLATLKQLVAVDDKVVLSRDAIGEQLLHKVAHHAHINCVRLLIGSLVSQPSLPLPGPQEHGFVSSISM
jgi:hypothetical protein